MKICHVITTIERGGAEKQLLLLCRAQKQSNHQVHVVYLKGKPDLKREIESSGATVDSSLSELSWLRKLAVLMKYRKKDFDVFHAHLPVSELIAALALPKSKLFVSRHNTEKLLRGRLRIFSSCVSRFVESRTLACIAISNTVRKYMLETKEWRNPATIHTVYYGYDKALQKAPINGRNKLSFLCISRLTPQKDIQTLLRAFKEHLKRFSEDSLIIIGEGPEEIILREMVVNSNLEANVTFKAKTQHVDKEIASADVFVLTSRYEGFGLVLLESMAIGRPILAAANLAVQEVMGVDFLGLFPVGDHEYLVKKMALVRDEAVQLEIIEYQDRNLQRFTIETALQETLVIYKKSHVTN